MRTRSSCVPRSIRVVSAKASTVVDAKRLLRGHPARCWRTSRHARGRFVARGGGDLRDFVLDRDNEIMLLGVFVFHGRAVKASDPSDAAFALSLLRGAGHPMRMPRPGCRFRDASASLSGRGDAPAFGTDAPCRSMGADRGGSTGCVLVLTTAWRHPDTAARQLRETI